VLRYSLITTTVIDCTVRYAFRPNEEGLDVAVSSN
jgi:hypothetical protein